MSTEEVLPLDKELGEKDWVYEQG
jgi:serine/threonine protein kinase